MVVNAINVLLEFCFVFIYLTFAPPKTKVSFHHISFVYSIYLSPLPPSSGLIYAKVHKILKQNYYYYAKGIFLREGFSHPFVVCS
jgi:hypothetical protein